MQRVHVKLQAWTHTTPQSATCRRHLFPARQERRSTTFWSAPWILQWARIYRGGRDMMRYECSTSSTAQGGGGSFKNRKPIGEVGCCESRMADRSHWWTDGWLRSPLFLSFLLLLWLSTYLPIYVSIYLSVCLSIHPSIHLSIYLSIYLPIYLSICLSVFLSIHPSIHLS